MQVGPFSLVGRRKTYAILPCRGWTESTMHTPKNMVLQGPKNGRSHMIQDTICKIGSQ